MVNQKQRARMIRKLERLCSMCDALFFVPACKLNVEIYETAERLYTVPDKALFKPISAGDKWGEEESFGWFKSKVIVDKCLEGRPLFVRPSLGGYEGLLFVNDEPSGAFAEKIVVTSHGNHYCCCIAQNPKDGEEYELALEYYAGHHVPGTQPFDTGNGSNFTYTFNSIELCHKNQLAIDFAIDLTTLLQIYQHADGHFYRKEDIYYLLEELHAEAPYTTASLSDENIWQKFFKSAISKMKCLLEKPACESDGRLSLIGHSHMDTAWLWPRKETIKKCARTAANALNYMQQYPEYQFLQSSTYHYKLIKEYYPSLYAKIKKMVELKRFEPNGGCFIECDCNITSGESMVRQFLWAQRFTREEFGYTADCFWLPDTFGYSASIPQIMKGCGLEYFLTTKLSWNDTNQFPYESFWWEGIDGTRVLTHFNITQDGPYPAQTIQALRPKDGQYKSGKRFFAFGEGDGGGGPEFCMIEAARRSQNILGAPKAEYESLSCFMNKLAKNKHLPHFKGELYLELHRATLTNQPLIKRNNRKAELSHRNLELVNSMQAVLEKAPADISESNKILEGILINQFHDILPGTCIEQAHKDCYNDLSQALIMLQEQTHNILGHPAEDEKSISAFNPLSGERNDAFTIVLPRGKVPDCNSWQIVEKFEQSNTILIDGFTVPAFGVLTVPIADESNAENDVTSFTYRENMLDTPYFKVTFDDNGYISSLYDKRSARQICKQHSLPLGAITWCENVPAMWDSWDIDADSQFRFKPCLKRISSKIENGSVAHIRESVYQISHNTTACVRTIFYKNQPNIEYETLIDTQDENLFICAEFGLELYAATARFDIQYGHVQRPTTQNTCYEQARFEVCHHKYVDLSEQNYGIALLNDCKYGVHISNDTMRLSLHYGATHPDKTASKGRHFMKYALLAHEDGFSAQSVVAPAYCFNQPMIPCSHKASRLESLFSILQNNIIAESIKPCEDIQKAIIVRLYECEGAYTKCNIKLNKAVNCICKTNMLEEEQEAIQLEDSECRLNFKPFEIITLKLSY